MGMLYIKSPNVIVPFDPVVAALGICPREEIFGNTDKIYVENVYCKDVFLAGKIIILRADHIIPLRGKNALGWG